MPRRIAQERVPTASNVGSRDVTSAFQPTPVIPFGFFSRVSGPFGQNSGRSVARKRTRSDLSKIQWHAHQID